MSRIPPLEQTREEYPMHPDDEAAMYKRQAERREYEEERAERLMDEAKDRRADVIDRLLESDADDAFERMDRRAEDVDSSVDHRYTDEITCPWCGCVHGDSWERRKDDGEDDCDDCGKTFTWSRNITVDYITERKGP